MLKTVGLGCTFACILLALSSPAAVVTGYLVFAFDFDLFPAAVIVLGIGLFPAFWCFIRLWLAQLVLVDQNAGIFESIEKAWQLPSGHFWRLLGAYIVFISPILFWVFAYVGSTYMLNGIPEGTTVSGILLCNAGTVPTTMFYWLGMCLAYLRLTEEG